MNAISEPETLARTSWKELGIFITGDLLSDSYIDSGCRTSDPEHVFERCPCSLPVHLNGHHPCRAGVLFSTTSPEVFSQLVVGESKIIQILRYQVMAGEASRIHSVRLVGVVEVRVAAHSVECPGGTSSATVAAR